MLGDFSVGRNFCNEGLEQVQEERDHLLEEVNSYKVKEKKFEKLLLEKDVARTAMERSLVDLERIWIHLETEAILLTKTN